VMGETSGKSVFGNIRSVMDYRARMDYVHFSPVKHGLASHPASLPYSTFQKCVALGLYEPAWAALDNTTGSSGIGERK
jgi:putative transposase